VRATVATASPGASLNDLTDGERLDDLTGNAAVSGIAIEVERARPLEMPIPALA